MTIPDWWRQPRRISVVVDNPSWILSYAEELVATLQVGGDDAVLCRCHDDISPGAIAFYLGCIHITPVDVLLRNKRNLVVHESDLPKGRGFSPLSWQVLEGRNEIPVCLLEAVDGPVDSGPIIYRDVIKLSGHELIAESRALQADVTLRLCKRFLKETLPLAGEDQSGTLTTYRRRRPADSELALDKTLGEQFNLMRIVDNQNYPAFFVFAGQRYIVRIEKDRETSHK